MKQFFENEQKIVCHDLAQSVFQTLTSLQRSIPTVFLYDALGSRLFEKITQLPEYYPSRLEINLLTKLGADYLKKFENCDIVDLGSGNCSKICCLFNNMDYSGFSSLRYVPFDVSWEILLESAKLLISRFPQLNVHALEGDFLTQLHLLPSGRKKLVCFFGSTIGNFESGQRVSFLSDLSKQMKEGDNLLLGVDLVKPMNVLERAYNDSGNVTALFNLNILNSVNALTGSDFNTALFRHVAYYNEELSRVEMYLEALESMAIHSPAFPRDVKISKGERIHTENSHKFTIVQIADEAECAGLTVESLYTDNNKWYSLVEMKKGGDV